MNANFFRLYIKYNYRTWIFWLLVIIASALIGHRLIGFYLLLPIIVLSRSIYHFKDRLIKISKLKAKGLTEKDIENIDFVKKWDETRRNGLWKYCIKDGGIITGVLLGFLCSGIVNWVLHKSGAQEPFSDLSSGFAFIGYCYATGALLGIILYRALWVINERKFFRLTDPLNTIFTARKESFTDLI